MPSRRLTAGVMLLLLVAFAAGSCPAAAFSSAKGYRVTPPPGWRTSTSGLMGTDVIFLARPHDRFAANVTVVVTAGPPAAGLSETEIFRQVRAEVNARYPAVFTGYKRLAQEMTVIQGATAMRTTATYLLGTPPRLTRVCQVYALKNGKFYIFTLTTLAAGFAPYEAAFNGMLHSVRWPTDSTPKTQSPAR